jgi:hypothetical protein
LSAALPPPNPARRPDSSADWETYEVLLAYIGGRVTDAMRELARRSPRLSPKERLGRVSGHREIPTYKWKTVKVKDGRGREVEKQVLAQTGKTQKIPVYEAVCEVDFATDGVRERRAERRLECAMDMFCRQKVGVGVVRLEYRRFAEAHTYWWREGARVPAPGKEVDFR